MAGPQFFHLQSYSRKPNKAGQSIAQVLGEAARLPEFSHHVPAPKPCRVIFGLSPAEVQIRHDAMVAAGRCEVTLKDGITAMRGIRKDRHTLMTAVASHPYLTTQINANPEARADYDAWVARNVAYLRDLFGDQLVSVIEHSDEEHPHIHAYILPLDDPACEARHLNPSWVAKITAEDAARAEGEPDKIAVKIGNAAYRSRARELQDDYHLRVGIPSGLTRTGPKRKRLSRQQWREEKAQASHMAKMMQTIKGLTDDLEGREDDLARSIKVAADELAARLDQAEALHNEAEDDRLLAAQERDRLAVLAVAQEKEAAARRAAAEEEARRVREKGKKDAADLVANAERAALKIRQNVEVS
ncbi:hypothetical protein [Pseudogemmobacter sonorensis]|uniref:hypothetical protein n=1 Tax=Pseudogemmobacter sonorensis TaxID=2989681 RepID=UPI0036CBD109